MVISGSVMRQVLNIVISSEGRDRLAASWAALKGGGLMYDIGTVYEVMSSSVAYSKRRSGPAVLHLCGSV